MIYIISTIMLSLVLITKMFFLNSSLNIISTTILFLVIVIGLYDYLLHKNRLEKKRFEWSKFTVISFVVIVITLTLSFYININKKVLLWDSVALYDARAKFLLNGTSFGQMVEISKYDPVNSYYYTLYPPFTSMIHYFWYLSGINIPVGVFYSIEFLFLAIVVFLLTKDKLGSGFGIFLTALTVTSYTIFSTSLLEYTNIPFTLQFIIGLFLLSEYLEGKYLWKMLYGIALIVTSQWIRFLEPLWLGVILVFVIYLLRKKYVWKNVFYSILIVLYGVIEYMSWNGYTSNFGNLTKIVSFSLLHLLEPAVGLFTGSFLNILVFFIKSWGAIFIVHVSAIFLTSNRNNELKDGFLKMTLLACIVIYFSGLYFVSFQSVWWDKLGDSLIRGSTFMIPVSGYLIFKYLRIIKYEDK